MGGAQGRLSTHVAFCAHLHEVMRGVAGLQPPVVVRVGIIDDHYMVGPPTAIAASWPALETSLANAGYEMRRHKCKVWSPGKRLGWTIGADARLAMLTQIIPEAHDAIALLGAAAEGKWITWLGPFAAAATPAMERVLKAEAVCDALRRYVAAQPDEYCKQSAHVILHKSVTMALSYDVRVNPHWVVEHAVLRLQAAVHRTAAAIYEVDGPLLEPRMRLPGRFGGLTLRCGSAEEAA